MLFFKVSSTFMMINLHAVLLFILKSASYSKSFHCQDEHSVTAYYGNENKDSYPVPTTKMDGGNSKVYNYYSLCISLSHDNEPIAFSCASHLIKFKHRLGMH